MRSVRRVLAIVATVCGLELAVVAVVGGAGLAAFTGPDGLLLAGMVVVIGGSALWSRRRRSLRRPPDPELTDLVHEQAQTRQPTGQA